MGDLTKGTTFTLGQTNVTHTDLNNLVDNATVNASLISGKDLCTDPHATDDKVLLYDYSASALKRVTPQALVEAGFSDVANVACPGFGFGYHAYCDGAHTITLLAQYGSGAEMALLLRDTNGVTKQIVKASSWTETIDATVSGAGGYATGVTFNTGTWYYTWLIYNEDTATLKGVLADTQDYSSMWAKLPSGYTYALLTGAAYCSNGTGPVLTAFWQNRETVVFNYEEVIATRTITSAPANLATTELAAFVACVPPRARKVHLSLITSDVTTVQPSAGVNYGRHKVNGNDSITVTLIQYNIAVGVISPVTTSDVVLRVSGYELDL